MGRQALKGVVAIALLGALVCVSVDGAKAASISPFNALDGVWGGTGQVRLQGGKTERLVCKAYYNAKARGAQMGMAIRCASTSYKIELRSALLYNAGRISGTWEERTHNASGKVLGDASGSAIRMTFTGNVSGTVAVSFGRFQQRVSITALGGNAASIYLNLSRN